MFDENELIEIRRDISISDDYQHVSLGVNESSIRQGNPGLLKQFKSFIHSVRISCDFYENKSSHIKYMVPPCNHIFHTDCLISWFERDSALKCPVCRMQLPSYS